MTPKVAIVGAGMGGLASAVKLAAGGYDVTVFEQAGEPGGKVGVASRDGVTFDTGPSVLTMPFVLDEILGTAGTSLEEHLELIERAPWFRYVYPDGVELDIAPSLEQTLENVSQTLGASARDDLDDFLRYAGRIWEAAAPNFIFAPAPSIGSMLRLGLQSVGALSAIDPFRTMWSAIESRVRSHHLRWLLARYATYVGSHPKRAPATLNCISWVELGLGSHGVAGGMYEIARTLEGVARDRGATFRYETPVRKLTVREGRVREVVTHATREEFDAVVVNGDVHHLVDDLLEPTDMDVLDDTPPLSMSGWTAVVRATRRPADRRTPHTVLFPNDYLREFTDVFDSDHPPREPTVYLCAQERAHDLQGWSDAEPIFVMANAPPEPIDGHSNPEVWTRLRRRVLRRLRDADLIDDRDAVVWERSPRQLAERFPGSHGALYGAASNSRFAAFRRPPNDLEEIEGLYLASGSAHPGGGVPMCLQSGRLAAEAVAR